jgi:phosphohistidine phosphatase SixA
MGRDQEPLASCWGPRRGPGGDVMIELRIVRQFGRSVACVLAISLVITPGLAADDAKEAWAALVKGGHVALVRHGNAPPGYGGDPPGFKLDDCKTQRNLDELGREQARALGEAFRNHGVRVDRILSSPWCRCLETARLMAIGPVESSWALVPDRDPSTPVRVLELKEMVSAWRGPGTLVLVTHALTVRPLTGFLPNQGETVVLKPGPGSGAGADLVGRIATPRK